RCACDGWACGPGRCCGIGREPGSCCIGGEGRCAWAVPETPATSGAASKAATSTAPFKWAPMRSADRWKVMAFPYSRHVSDLPGAPSATGLWEQVDEKSGQPESWFRIQEKNGVYEGTIVKMFLKPGEDPNWACDKCEGAERGKPVLGLTLIKGMQRSGNSYEN